MNLDDFSTEVEGRRYLDPEVSLREQESFINNLRQSQIDANKEIATQTYNLGTAVPSNLGGLMGGEGYWTSRYQTPQTNATVANLRAAAQAKALNDVLANEQAVWKNRYQQAYRNYQSRQNAKANQPSTTGGGGSLDIDTNAGAGETVEVDTYQPQAGQIIPNTDYVSDYQDAATGEWYQLTSPREIDVIAANSSLAGRNPSDGTVVTVPSGKTLRYLAAKNEWYEQTNSAGPNTYSPRSR